MKRMLLTLALVGLVVPGLRAETVKGTPPIKSCSALTFGPKGVLFVADPMAAVIYAIETGDDKLPDKKVDPKIETINEKIASQLGIESSQLQINDAVVNPASQSVYIAVTRGRNDGAVVLFKVDRGTGKLAEFSLKDVNYSKVSLPNPVPERPTRRGQTRRDAITSMVFLDGKLYVAGLSNEEFASNLRIIPFPFKEADRGTSVEIYHGAHGALETHSPVRTFTTLKIKDQDHLMAAYTCTPLVKIPVSDLKAGQKIKGVTVAELGNRNRPLDMVAYEKNGKQFLLIANSSRGVMKVNTEGVADAKSISSRISGTAGLKYETIQDLQGVEQLAKLTDTQAVILSKNQKGEYTLTTIDLP